MGNAESSGGGGGNGRRRNQRHDHSTPSILPTPPQPEVSSGNRYIFAATMPYAQYPNPNPPQYYHFVGYYPPPTTVSPNLPAQLPAPLDHHHRSSGDHPAYHQGWRNPYSPAPSPRTPVVEHQKAVTIRNDVNLKKETLMIEPDEENPGRYLVAFTFDATASGRLNINENHSMNSITVLFFAKEGHECSLVPTKETSLAPVTVSFSDGLGQKFKQPPGTGIDFSMFEEFELIKEGEAEVYPLAVKAENNSAVAPNSQITQAVFERKENGEYQVRAVKQVLWVNGTRYELQEIYGVGNSFDGDLEGNDPGKECVICLSELRNTAALPCRHMCLCSDCAKVLSYRTNRCPICRQPINRLLEMKVGDRGEDDRRAPHC